MNNAMQIVVGLMVLGGAVPAGAASESPWESHEAIRAAAANAVQVRWLAAGGRVEAVADELDPRVRLSACDEALDVSVPFSPGKTGRVTAQVRCLGPTPWKLHVPVRLTVFQQVVVTTRAMPRDGVLTPDDVSLAERDTGALDYGYLSAADDAIGQRLRRPLAAGEAVTPGHLEMPLLVRRGQQVTLEGRVGGLTVRMAGIARDDGIRGEVIPVENISSGREVEAIVRSAKSVEVLLK